MYALCVSGAVNTQGFVWKFFYALYKKIHSFIYSSPLLLPFPLVLSPALPSFVLVSLFAGSIVLHVLRELSQGLGLELRVHLTQGKAF